MKDLRFKKPSPALVIAIIAMFVGLGGGAYAGNKVGTNKLKKQSVTTGKLAPKSVATGKLKGQSVTTGKLADQSVATNKLSDGSVNESKLAEGAVTNLKIAPEAVGNLQISQSAVDGFSIQDGAVSKSKLADEAVGAKQLGNIITRAEAVTILNGQTGGGTALCLPNEKVISGGYNTALGQTGAMLVQENLRAPGGLNGWRVQGLNLGAGPTSLTVTAYCLVE